jgi:hypothetical protein
MKRNRTLQFPLRSRLIVLLGTLLAGLLAPGSTLAGTSDRWECDDLADYQLAVFSAIPAEDIQTLSTILDGDVETLRPSEFREAAEIFDDWASELEDFSPRDVPRAAEEYHEALIDNMSLFASMFTSMSTGGVFGAIAYVEVIEESTAELEDANQRGEQRCPQDWPFGTDDSGTL